MVVVVEVMKVTNLVVVVEVGDGVVVEAKEVPEMWWR